MKLQKTMVTAFISEHLDSKKHQVKGYQYGKLFIYKNIDRGVFYLLHKSGYAIGLFYKLKQAKLAAEKMSEIVDFSMSKTQFKRLPRKTIDKLLEIRMECRK